MAKLRVGDFLRCAFVNAPGCGKCRQDVAIQRRVNLGRHRCFYSRDTFLCVGRQMVGDEGTTKSTDTIVYNSPLSGVAFKALNFWQLAARPTLAHFLTF
jgi:hypothetical protein